MGCQLKYHNGGSFEKHLQDAAPDHLSLVYLVVSPCPFERKKIIEKICEALLLKDPPPLCSPPQASIFDELNTRSLLGEKTVVTLDGVDKWKKAEIEPLLRYIENPSPFSHLILGAASGKGCKDLYARGKKHLVSLDLSEEKPWDRKARLERYAVHCIEQKGKNLSPQAAAHLLELLGPDLSALEQELHKLLCFIGVKKEISLSDIHAICCAKKELLPWHLAEAILWDTKPVPIDPHFDLQDLFPVIGQLRSELQTALQIRTLLEQGENPGNIREQFPQWKGEKKIAHVRTHPSAFYRHLLHSLFEMELLAKNSSFSPTLLLNQWIAHGKATTPP